MNTIGTDDDDIVPAPMPPRLNALIHFPTHGEASSSTTKFVEVEIFGAALKWSTVADHASEKYRALYDDDTKTIVRLFRMSTGHNGVAEYPVWSTHLPEECDNVPFADLTFAPTGTDVTVLDLRAELHDDRDGGDDEATDDNGGRRRRKRNRQRSKSRDQTAAAAAPASPPRRQEKKQKTNASAPALPAPLALPAPPPAPTPAKGTKMAQPTPEKLGGSTGGGGIATPPPKGKAAAKRERQERDARERDARAARVRERQARSAFFGGIPPSRRYVSVSVSTATLEDVVTTYKYIDLAAV